MRSPSTSARPAAPRSTWRVKVFPITLPSPSATSQIRVFPRPRSRFGKSPATPGSSSRPAYRHNVHRSGAEALVRCRDQYARSELHLPDHLVGADEHDGRYLEAHSLPVLTPASWAPIELNQTASTQL